MQASLHVLRLLCWQARALGTEGCRALYQQQCMKRYGFTATAAAVPKPQRVHFVAGYNSFRFDFSGECGSSMLSEQVSHSADITGICCANLVQQRTLLRTNTNVQTLVVVHC
jgi:hypothetical protein